MKYLCKNCKSISKPGNEIEQNFRFENNCFICGMRGFDNIVLIPDYETPAQYEKRTGKPVADNTAVFYIKKIEGETHSGWLITTTDTPYFKFLKDMNRLLFVVIADPPTPPADDWRPEEA